MKLWQWSTDEGTDNASMNILGKVSINGTFSTTLLKILDQLSVQRPMIICDATLRSQQVVQRLIRHIEHTSRKLTVFSDFSANPKYNEVLQGIAWFKNQQCDFLVSIGGGSSIDVAKCIKAFHNLSSSKPYVEQPILPSELKHLAIPTTAGTGSEATHFAVLYYQETKYSIADQSLRPDYVILDAQLLRTLPEYQRKAGMLDALCQSIESYWALKATNTSRRYASKAIELILNAHQGFLVNQNKANQAMLQAADYAGMAIDITTTTAAHAMSYQLTTNYHIAHGHAVGLCLPAVWREMLVHMNLIEDPQQRQELSQVFDEIAYLLGFQEPMQAIDWLNHFIDDLQLLRPQLKNTAELETLVSAVNVQRLKNNPVPLHAEQLREIYAQVLNQGSSTR